MYHSDGPRIGNPPYQYTFYVSGAFMIANSSADLPHIGGTVVDSAEPCENEVLRSEVVTAVALLKLQFRRGHFGCHRILPVRNNPPSIKN